MRGLQSAERAERLLEFAIGLLALRVGYVGIDCKPPPLRDPAVHDRNPGLEKLPQVARHRQRLPQDLASLLDDAQPIVDHSVQFLEIAPQLLDLNRKRLIEMGVDKDLAESFLMNRNYTPIDITTKTAINTNCIPMITTLAHDTDTMPTMFRIVTIPMASRIHTHVGTPGSAAPI